MRYMGGKWVWPSNKSKGREGLTITFLSNSTCNCNLQTKTKKKKSCRSPWFFNWIWCVHAFYRKKEKRKSLAKVHSGYLSQIHPNRSTTWIPKYWLPWGKVGAEVVELDKATKTAVNYVTFNKALISHSRKTVAVLHRFGRMSQGCSIVCTRPCRVPHSIGSYVLQESYGKPFWNVTYAPCMG